MRIPPEALAPETLRNLVEEFVTREGTDYGERHYSLDAKVDQVLRQLAQGKVVLLYDPHTATCHLEVQERLAESLRDDPSSGDLTDA